MHQVCNMNMAHCSYQACLYLTSPTILPPYKINAPFPMDQSHVYFIAAK